MKIRFVVLTISIALISAFVLAQVPKKISYQGLLTTSMGTPATTGSYTLQFEAYDSSSGGSSLWTETDTGVSVQQGTFTVILGKNTPLNLAFNKTYFLQVTATAGPDISSPITFSPRAELTSAPYALRADTAEYAKVSPAGGGGPYLPLSGGTMSGAITNTGDPSITMGKGNFGTGNINDGTQAFVAGSNNRARGMYSVVGGGGGAINDSNSAAGGYSTIAGGFRNKATSDASTVSGGQNNTASHLYTTVSGGLSNTASNAYTTVSGGLGNTANGPYATVSGGGQNKARGQFSVVAGGGGAAGDSNAALGMYSTVPGGRSNTAAGSHSFAAGWHAKANHGGTFVWADSALTDFASTGSNQFLIRASGGVGIGTASPTKALEVSGSAKVSDTLFASNVSSNSPLRLQTAGTTRMYIDDATGRVGIGTTSPSRALHVSNSFAEIRLTDSDNSVEGQFSAYGGGIVDLSSVTFHPLTLSTNSAEQIRIGTNGNMGIGTTTPQSKLDVEGGAVVGATYSGFNPAPTNGLLVEGNVGIGHTSPTKKLVVQGSAMVSDTMFVGNVGIGTGIATPQNRLDVAGGAVIGTTYSGTNTAPINGLLVQGNVGIGTTSPNTTLHVSGPENATLTITSNGQNMSIDGNEIDGGSGLYLNFNIPDDVIIANGGGRVGIGDVSPDARLDVEQSSNTVAVFNRTTTDGTIIAFQQDGATEGGISVSGTTVSYNAFTGSHFSWTDQHIEEGTLVSLTGNNKRYHDDPNSEIIYGIEPSTHANDPTCIGAYLGLQESSLPAGNDNPHLVMAVGNGEMWVVERASNIRPGDYLISSDVPGYAMKDDPERFPIGFIVARAAEPVDWSRVSTSAQGVKRTKISVFFESFVRNSETTQLGRVVETQQHEIQDLKTQLKSLRSLVSRMSAIEANNTNNR